VAWLIKDEDMRALAPMNEVIEAFEIAMIDHARGMAPMYPRRIHVRSRSTRGKAAYSINTQIGGSTSLNVMAIRLMSNMSTMVRRWEPVDPVHEGHNSRNCGLIALFDMETSELLAVLPQFTISGLRVGATTGLAAKYLARQDAETVGVFGSSKVARGDLEGIAHARKLKSVKIFSPKADHRIDFAKEMSARLGIEVTPVDAPENAVRGVDMISVSTNSRMPVLDGDWLEPGQFLATTMSSPYPRQPLTDTWRERYDDPDPLPGLEIDVKALKRADMIAILSREMVLCEDQREILNPIEAGELSWDVFRELGDIAAGLCPGRQRAEDITMYKSSGGVGMQMAAIGAVVLRNAKKKGVGQEISADWFTGDMSEWHRKGFAPTQ
jgi:alanine dehydrogenase